MSVSEYTECTIRCSSSATSAWNGWDFGAVSVVEVMAGSLERKMVGAESPDIAMLCWVARLAKAGDARYPAAPGPARSEIAARYRRTEASNAALPPVATIRPHQPP